MKEKAATIDAVLLLIGYDALSSYHVLTCHKGHFG